MENNSRVQVTSMKKAEKVKVESSSVNKSVKEPAKKVKSTVNVNKSVTNN